MGSVERWRGRVEGGGREKGKRKKEEEGRGLGRGHTVNRGQPCLRGNLRGKEIRKEEPGKKGEGRK